MDRHEQMEFDALVNRLNDALDSAEKLGRLASSLRHENERLTQRLSALDADAFLWRHRYEQLKKALTEGGR